MPHMKLEQNESGAIYPSVEALAAELGISRQSAYAALRKGAIPAIRLGRRFIIPRAAVAKWLESAGRGTRTLPRQE
jgi:excisionase family DNA binding protein